MAPIMQCQEVGCWGSEVGFLCMPAQPRLASMRSWWKSSSLLRNWRRRICGDWMKLSSTCRKMIPWTASLSNRCLTHKGFSMFLITATFWKGGCVARASLPNHCEVCVLWAASQVLVSVSASRFESGHCGSRKATISCQFVLSAHDFH